MLVSIVIPQTIDGRSLLMLKKLSTKLYILFFEIPEDISN